MKSNLSRELINQLDFLKFELNRIDEKILNKKVIYVDYPIHSNGGDTLIFLGTLAFLKKNNYEIVKAYSCHNIDIDEIRTLITRFNCSILLHGGGNFGDIYQVHQNARTKIFLNFPETNIILLPQSAHFNSIDQITSYKEITTKLSNTFFYARDSNTLDIFKKLSVPCELMPDMAHFLFGSFTNYKKTENTLYFLRQDVEKNDVQINLDCESYDWKNLMSKADIFIIRILVNLQKKFFMNDFTFKVWCMYSNFMIKRFAKFFMKHNHVVTSRLHGHIFSCLLSIPNTVIDNSYKKNTRYINAWTGSIPEVEIFKSIN